jgi:hypothetical protein
MWHRIANFFERVGRTRASAELARQGYHDLARKLILEIE